MPLPVRIHLKNVHMGQYGYKNVKYLSVTERHRALNRVLKAGEPPLGLFRRLNALFVLFKKTQPKLSELFKQDRDWVKTKLY